MSSLIIIEYERILKDPTKVGVYPYNFKDMSTEAQQKQAVEIIGYAITYIMHYSPSDALKFMSFDLLKRLKLSSLLKYIKIPTGLKEKDQIMFILSLCFPQTIHFDPKVNIKDIYEKVIASKDGKDKNNKYTYPKGFFGNFDSKFNAAICLQFMIMRYLHVPDINSLYELFNDREKALKILASHYLQKPAKKLYNDDTLKYLHESLTPEERSDFLYFNCLYKKMYEPAEKKYLNKTKK